MTKLVLSLGTALVLALSSGSSMAQNNSTPAPVNCDEILATPGASVADIAEINDTSEVQVLQCQAADETTLSSNQGVADLRTALAANPRIAPKLSAAGVAADQVVAVRLDANGTFAFYTIGAFR